MRFPARRADDADVIRARLRALLAETRTPGWVPDDLDPGPDGDADPWGGPGGPLDPDDPGAGATDSGGDGAGATAAMPRGLGRHRVPAPTVRLDPGRGGVRALWLTAPLVALAVLAWTWSDRPAVLPAPPLPAGTSGAGPSSTPPGAGGGTAPGSAPADGALLGEVADSAPTLVVAVVGEVARPGLVTVPAGSRVADAVEAAGGMLAEADPASVNLAAPVVDGQQIAVGVPGGAPPGPVGSTGTPGSAPAGGGAVHLNSATAAELESLPGIGPVLAQRIVDHRDRQGSFASVEQLEDVPGIGPSVLAGLVDRVVL